MVELVDFYRFNVRWSEDMAPFLVVSVRKVQQRKLTAAAAVVSDGVVEVPAEHAISTGVCSVKYVIITAIAAGASAARGSSFGLDITYSWKKKKM